MAAHSQRTANWVASGGGLDLAVPQCEKGIGSLILKPDSPDLISGLAISPFPLWPDDRGYFLEVVRVGQGLCANFPAETTQVSSAFGYPDTIKAFHFHLYQTDVWVPAQGVLQFALVDLRKDSPTFGSRNTIFAGTLRPWQVRIPPGVAHGYKVIGSQPAMLIYVTDRLYNPEDEGRIPYNHPAINYDWETQHR